MREKKIYNYYKTFVIFFQITKLQAAIKFGEEDLPGAKVSCIVYIYDPKYSYICIFRTLKYVVQIILYIR